MKRFLNTALFLCFIFSAEKTTAQIILSESFENNFPPDGWVVFNAGIGNNWTLMPANSGYQLSGLKCMQYPSNQSFPANAWIFSQGFSLSTGITYRLSYWYREALAGKTEKMKVTLGAGQTVAAQTTILHDYSSITNTSHLQGIDNFTVPSNGVYNFAFQCYSAPDLISRLIIDSVVFEQITPVNCSGVPPSGTISAPVSACSGSPFTLKLEGVFTAAGLSFQWQSSPPGQGTFTNITGATTNPYFATQTTTLDYRCIVTCSNGGQNSISGIKTVTTPAICYCTPPPSVCSSSDMITNVTFAGINNSSTCSAGSTSGYGDYTVSVTPGSIAAGTTVPISVTVGNGGPENVAAWVDFNRNGIFEASEYKSIGSGSGTVISNTIIAPSTASPGLTRMRVRVRQFTAIASTDACAEFILGETEDYLVNITPFICSGTPVAGTISGPTTICASVSFTLTISGTYTGLSLQWQSSPVGQNNFTNISGATSTSLNTSQTAPTDYRCIVTCTANSQSATSAIFTVTTPALCYCLPPGVCISNNNITNVTFGSINNNSTCIINGYADYTTSVPAASVTAGTSVLLTVTVASTLNGSVAAWIDYNKNGVFEPGEFTFVGTGNATTYSKQVFIPSISLSGITRMRVRRLIGANLAAGDACLNINSGETEDYAINILPAPIVIYFTPFSDTLYDRVLNITARITQKDVGLNITDSLKPRLWIKKQSSSSWKQFAGQLISGNGNDGQWRFPVDHDSVFVRRNGCDSLQFYFVAQDLNTPFNLAALPEPGAVHTNVRIQITPPPVLFGYRLKPRLKDTVYVSAGDCRYKSLSGEKGLFQDINLKKLEGNLTILIESDLVEKGIYDLTGAGLNNYTLAIRPVNNVVRTISGDFYNSASIRLNGAKKVLIDGSNNGSGKYLKFNNAPTGFYDTLSNIKMYNSCDSIVIQNNIFDDVSDSHSGGEFSIILSWGNNKNIAVLNNFFTSNNINRLSDRYISSHYGNNKALIRGNEFNNFMEAAIQIVTACDDWIIDSNHFYRTLLPNFYSYDWSAISVKGGGHSITKNYIGGKAPFCGGGIMSFVDNPGASISGISAWAPYGTSPTLIENNRVDNISIALNNAAATNSFAGILSADNKTIIRNNIIGNPASATHTITVLAYYIYGINTYGSQPVEITNNTIASIKDQPDPIFQNLHRMAVIGISKANNSNGNPDYNASCVISGNKVFNLYNDRNPNNSLAPDLGGTAGIVAMYGSDNLIEKNLIYNISCTDGRMSGIGIVTGGGQSTSVVQRNKVFNLTNTDLSDGGCCGDDYYNGAINGITVSSSSSNIDILNNQIALTNGTNTNPASIRGIYMAYSNPSVTNKRIIYNSVYIGGTSSSTGGSGAYVAQESSIKNLYNNIFYNERTGGTKGHFAIRTLNSFVPASFWISTKSNHNLYVVTDTTKFAHWGSTPAIGWGAWKTNTGLDDTSYLVLPVNIPSSQLFADKANADLNINYNNSICWYANEKARPFAQLSSDYDSLNIRNTSIVNGYTDIGSDEFITNTMAPGGVCSGGNISFTSNLSGTTYQWQQKIASGFIDLINNANYSGVTSATLQIANTPYSWSGNIYRCTVNGNTFSNLYTLTVVQTLTPSVSIASSTTTACSGANITFTATPANAGVNPSYQWLKNGANTGTNSSVFTTNSLANGDVISVRLTSGAACVTNATALSNALTVNITPSLPLSITIAGNTTVLQGIPVLLTSSTINAGAGPLYQWQDSTASHTWQNINGAIASTLIYLPAQTGNKVRCLLTSNAICVNPTTAISNVLTFTVTTATAINPVPVFNFGIRYYPVPVNSVLYIDSLKLSDKWQTLEIVSMDGKTVAPVIRIVNKTTAFVNVNQLTAGQYIAVLRRKNNVAAYLKFIKL